MSPNDADGMANSVDPDQTAPLGAVWSGSALFAQAYLSENLGSLRYIIVLAFSEKRKMLKFVLKLQRWHCLQATPKPEWVVMVSQSSLAML